jgi:hypothetical protein
MLSRNLLSLLISLLLALSPFAALDVVAAAVNNENCMTMAGDNDGTAGSNQSIHASDSQAVQDCAHCKDESCDAHNCASHGCSAGHGLSLIPSSVPDVLDFDAANHTACLGTGLVSLSIPPPLRPPV